MYSKVQQRASGPISLAEQPPKLKCKRPLFLVNCCWSVPRSGAVQKMDDSQGKRQTKLRKSKAKHASRRARQVPVGVCYLLGVVKEAEQANKTKMRSGRNRKRVGEVMVEKGNTMTAAAILKD